MDSFLKIVKSILTIVLLFPLVSEALILSKPLSISAQIGASQLYIGNSALKPTATETDRLQEIDNPFVPEFSLGVDYNFPLSNMRCYGFDWFPYIKTAINFRYLNQEIVGQVFQYQDPQMNNYTYTLTLNSFRIMLDAMLPLMMNNNKTTLYLLGGIGQAWNQLGYEDITVPGVQGGTLNLNNRTTNGFTYELGAGVLYPIDCVMAIFLEFRYAHFPSIKTASTGTLNGASATISPASFTLESRTFSFGINWKF